jgi:hypothetical protein
VRGSQGAETEGRVGEDDFVARAGAAALLRVGTFERRETLRRLLIEAQEGQELRPQRPAPGPPEDEPGEGEEPQAEGEGPGEEDHEFELDHEQPEGVEDDDLPAGALVYALSDRSALDEALVGANLARWLDACPTGPLTDPSEAAWRAVKALACGWAATIVHALADGPRTLAELQTAAAGDLSRERLLGYLEDMERTGLAEARRDPGGEARYAAGGWLREAVAPLVAAARLERRRLPGLTAAPDELDVHAAFALTLPRFDLPADLSGACRLGVEVGGGGPPRLTGVTARLESGRVTSVAAGLDERADAWAVGSCGDWLDAVVEPDEARVRTGGDRRLADVVIPALHGLLFAGAPYDEPEEYEPADRGAERRRRVAAAGPEAHREFAAERIDEVAGLRRALEARGAAPVEDGMEITVAYQMHIWEEDLAMLFRVAEGDPLPERLADELLKLWTARVDASDPDEPFI